MSRLCMFHPVGHPMERGWVGRIDGDRVVQLAAQTLQSYFTGGGTAREHAEYRLADVRLLPPVLHPPSIRIFDGQASFAFANPAGVVGAGVEIVWGADLAVAPRLAAVIGADAVPAAFTILAEWRDPGRPPPKDRDFALGLGPVAVTADAFEPDGVEAVVRIDGRDRLRQVVVGFDWQAGVSLAAERTRLFPGDLVAGPTWGAIGDIAAGAALEIEVDGIGALEQRVVG